MKKSPENRVFGLGQGVFLDACFSGLNGQTVSFRNRFFGGFFKTVFL